MTNRKQSLAHISMLLLAIACRADDVTLAGRVPGEPAAPSASAGRYSEWSAPVNFGPVVNSVSDDQAAAMTRDGLTLYFLSNRPGGLGGTDLWASHRASSDAPWGTPVNLGPPINSSVNEAPAHITRDGHRMYFASDRPAGLLDFNFLVSRRTDTHDPFAWQHPVDLGPPVNTPMFEGAATIFGSDFIFSRGLTSTAGHDIYVSEMRGDAFTTPRVMTELSSAAEERRPAIRFDGREIFFHSNRPGGIGQFDLWSSTRDGNGVSWSPPVNLGAGINSPANDNGSFLSFDGTMLVFASNRPGGSGALDLYYATRSVVSPR
jgi:hypothetical protein